ncbi:uncharacterized protein LOC115021605 [Cottoperca gobio]|uniref:Uncharacterized protein LOC115021605 n=1 Tax=Cottoperca gobio TaxID=56716 RepID=A0A6J2RAZ1_COTGO|nr:uncharacterized protein LOC115021605 [Cottoperca gobio]
MQKGFIFLLIIWNSSPFASGKTTNHHQFSLGCQAVIPCKHYRTDSHSWFYKKDEHSNTIRIYFKDKKGVEYHEQLLRKRVKVLRNGSLAINIFAEDDQGLYWCEHCFQGNCWVDPPEVIGMKKEILEETRETFYIVAGEGFTHACPDEFTDLKWTFEASNMAALRNLIQGSESDFVTSNQSMHIVKVKRADAGKYTCWKRGCNGRRQKLLTINLCVITVHHSEDSSVSCDVMCDMEFSYVKPNSTLKVETGAGTTSVLVHPNVSLNCSAKQMFDGHSTVNSTHGPSNALNKTTDIPPEAEHLIPIIYGISSAVTCLTLMALLICYLRPSLWAAFPFPVGCCCLNSSVEEESSIDYSTVVFGRSAETTMNHTTHSNSYCVYSEIKV